MLEVQDLDKNSKNDQVTLFQEGHSQGYMSFYAPAYCATTPISLYKGHFTRQTLHSQVTETLMLSRKVLDILDTRWRKSSKTEETFCMTLLLNAVLQYSLTSIRLASHSSLIPRCSYESGDSYKQNIPAFRVNFQDSAQARQIQNLSVYFILVNVSSAVF